MTHSKYLLSIVVPVYNESAIIVEHLHETFQYLDGFADEYDWEVVAINDGSSDESGQLLEELSQQEPRLRVLHHFRNFGLGHTLRYGIANTRGDFVVTLDADLSYDLDHVARLLAHQKNTNARMVLASPYMEGGRTSKVPWVRKFFSVWGNRFLGFFAKGHIATLTSMVRLYDGPFIRSLNLRSSGMDVMPETIYKATLLGVKIEEIPAHLNWERQLTKGQTRISAMRLLNHIGATGLVGFVMRPFLFLVLPGLLIGGIALFTDYWIVHHSITGFAEARQLDPGASLSDGLAQAFRSYPHTFVMGMLFNMLSLQFVGMGALALQNKRYFEELYHLGSDQFRQLSRPDRRTTGSMQKPAAAPK